MDSTSENLAVEEQPVEIKINMKALKFKDLKLLLKYAKNSGKNPGDSSEAQISNDDMEKMLSLLDRAVVGGIDEYDLAQLPEIVQALSEAMAQNAARKN